jgi:hypothetical protein
MTSRKSFQLSAIHLAHSSEACGSVAKTQIKNLELRWEDIDFESPLLNLTTSIFKHHLTQHSSSSTFKLDYRNFSTPKLNTIYLYHSDYPHNFLITSHHGAPKSVLDIGYPHFTFLPLIHLLHHCPPRVPAI